MYDSNTYLTTSSKIIDHVLHVIKILNGFSNKSVMIKSMTCVPKFDKVDKLIINIFEDLKSSYYQISRVDESKDESVKIKTTCNIFESKSGKICYILVSHLMFKYLNNRYSNIYTYSIYHDKFEKMTPKFFLLSEIKIKNYNIEYHKKYVWKSLLKNPYLLKVNVDLPQESDYEISTTFPEFEY